MIFIVAFKFQFFSFFLTQKFFNNTIVNIEQFMPYSSWMRYLSIFRRLYDLWWWLGEQTCASVILHNSTIKKLIKISKWWPPPTLNDIFEFDSIKVPLTLIKMSWRFFFENFEIWNIKYLKINIFWHLVGCHLLMIWVYIFFYFSSSSYDSDSPSSAHESNERPTRFETIYLKSKTCCVCAHQQSWVWCFFRFFLLVPRVSERENESEYKIIRIFKCWA